MSNMVNLSRAALLQNVKRLQEAVANSGVPTHKYLSFHAQRGEFYVKDNDNEVSVPVGTRFAVNWQEITHGFVCWKGGKVFDSVSWNLLARPSLPDVDALPDHGPYETDANNRQDGWKEQVSIPLKDLKTGIEYIFKTGPDSSVRATRRFLGELTNELALRLPPDGADADAVKIGLPVLVNGKSHFVPKGRTNKVFVPKFDLEKEWIKDEAFNMMSVKGAGDGVYTLALVEGQKAKSAMITDNVTDAEIEG